VERCIVEWCHIYNFEDSYGEWSAIYGSYSYGVGWVHTVYGYAAVAWIQKILPGTVNFTYVKAEFVITGDPGPIRPLYEGAAVVVDGTDWVRNNNAAVNSGTYLETSTPKTGSSTLKFLIQSGNPTYPNATVTLKNITLRGTGVNPFAPETEAETEQQQALDEAFDDIKNALQADPEADISSLITTYQGEIEDAFGVEFANDPTADAWSASVVALHFARLGLEAAATAFEQWVEAEIEAQDLCRTINRFDLFQRIMGEMTFHNRLEPQINIAFTEGPLINVYHRPIPIDGMKECVQLVDSTEIILDQIDEEDDCPTGTTFSRQAYERDVSNNLISSGRQAVMTPNNLIHELGHSLDNFSGFGVKLIGSILNAIDNARFC
jgi:hypothetical protein